MAPQNTNQWMKVTQLFLNLLMLRLKVLMNWQLVILIHLNSPLKLFVHLMLMDPDITKSHNSKYNLSVN